MANRFENRFSLPPDEEPKPIPNNDGASASDNLPFKVTPEQAGKIVEEGIPEAIPVEDTEQTPSQPEDPLAGFPEDQRKVVEDLADKQMDLLRQLSSSPSSAMDPKLNAEKRAVDEELNKLHSQIESGMGKGTKPKVETEPAQPEEEKPFFDYRAPEVTPAPEGPRIYSGDEWSS